LQAFLDEENLRQIQLVLDQDQHGQGQVMIPSEETMRIPPEDLEDAKSGTFNREINTSHGPRRNIIQQPDHTCSISESAFPADIQNLIANQTIPTQNETMSVATGGPELIQ